MKKHRALLVPLFAAAISPGPAIGQDTRTLELFTWDGRTIAPSLETIREEYPVAIDFESLQLGVDRLEFEIPGGERVSLAVERYEEKDNLLKIVAKGNSVTFVGTVVDKTIFSAMIFSENTYKLSFHAAAEEARLQEIATSVFAPDVIAREIEEKALKKLGEVNSESIQDSHEHGHGHVAPKGTLPPPTAPSPVTISVAVVYTPAANTAAVGPTGLPLLPGIIANAHSLLETALTDSDLDWITVNLDYTGLVDPAWNIQDGLDVFDSIYQLGGDLRLPAGVPGYFPHPQIVAWQEQNGYDHVHLIVDDITDVPVGVAYDNYLRTESAIPPGVGTVLPRGRFAWDTDFFRNRRGYSVSEWTATEDNLVYAHEFAHTFGMAHNDNDPEFQELVDGWFSRNDATDRDSRGHQVNLMNQMTTVSKSTIMSVDDFFQNECTQSCPRQPLFSNSTKQFEAQINGQTVTAPAGVGISGAEGRENYRVPFETARPLSFFYPSELFEDSFSANPPNCDSTPVGWDLTTGTTSIANSPGGLSCALALLNSTIVGTVQETIPNQESFRTRYVLDLSNISTALDAEKVKIHNMQCAGGLLDGCPTPGMVQHKLKGGDAQVPFRIKGWFRETNGVAPNLNPKRKWEVDLQAGINVIETELIIADPGCTGIGRVWINNDDEQTPDIEETDLCNEGFPSGVDRANYGVISPNTEWITEHPGEALYFDEVVERQWTFIGCGSVPC